MSDAPSRNSAVQPASVAAPLAGTPVTGAAAVATGIARVGAPAGASAAARDCVAAAKGSVAVARGNMPVAATAAEGGVLQQPVRCLVTAGPTREFFDPVRFVSNPSSGKMGYAIAAAAAALGWSVDLVSGPVALAVPAGVRCHKVVTADDMLGVTEKLFPQADILIKTAAVCDFRPKARSAHKVKKDALAMEYAFEPTVDILKTLAAQRRPGQYLVGFAAETEHIERHARQKLAAKNLDCICANFVGEGGAFEADANTLHVIERGGAVVVLGPAAKEQIARELVALLAQRLAQG